MTAAMIDLVTGEAMKEVYLELNGDYKDFVKLNKNNQSLPPQDWFDRNLYIPVVTNPQDDGTTLLRVTYHDLGETRPQTKVRSYMMVLVSVVSAGVE